MLAFACAALGCTSSGSYREGEYSGGDADFHVGILGPEWTRLRVRDQNDLAFLHDRQPVLLDVEEARLWLASSTARAVLAELLAPALPVPLQVTPVSEYVNNARHKGEDCIVATGNPQVLPASPRHLH